MRRRRNGETWTPWTNIRDMSIFSVRLGLRCLRTNSTSPGFHECTIVKSIPSSATTPFSLRRNTPPQYSRLHPAWPALQTQSGHVRANASEEFLPSQVPSASQEHSSKVAGRAMYPMIFKTCLRPPSSPSRNNEPQPRKGLKFHGKHPRPRPCSLIVENLL